MNSTEISDKSINSIIESKRLSSLKELYINNCHKLTSQGIHLLMNSDILKQLYIVDISHNQFTFELEENDYSQKYPKLIF